MGHAIIKRLLIYCDVDFVVEVEFPLRGGEILSQISSYNILSADIPVICLIDLNGGACPPQKIEKLLSETPKNDKFVFRIAVDEAESWLMSDRKGFARYFHLPLELIPQVKSESRIKPHIVELSFPYKPSIYLLNEIIPHSRNSKMKEKLIPKDQAKKGREYNSTMINFIENRWNIDEATNNSYSLKKAVENIQREIS